MLQPETTHYYVWIGQFYTGQGEVVEVGSWLGGSTTYILDGLVRNPHFQGRRLRVYDDFIWRAGWMDPAFDHFTDSSGKPDEGQSFQPLFEQYLAAYADSVEARACRLAAEPANEHLPELSWTDDQPIEMVFVDCGRTVELNEAWWKALAPSFIPNLTLLVLQDWQTHKEVPPKWWNQMWNFTESKGTTLDLVHELRGGGVSTFLYRGTN